MAKTVATKNESTLDQFDVVEPTTVVETVVKAKTPTKTYADGVQDTMDKVMAYLDGVVESNKGVGYIHTLETIREAINNINN
jgi:hypothetical protein